MLPLSFVQFDLLFTENRKEKDMTGIAMVLIGVIFSTTNIDNEKHRKIGNALMIAGVLCAIGSFLCSDTFA